MLPLRVNKNYSRNECIQLNQRKNGIFFAYCVREKVGFNIRRIRDSLIRMFVFIQNTCRIFYYEPPEIY